MLRKAPNNAQPESMLDIRQLALPQACANARDWNESIPAGVSLLLDESGELAAQWLPVLAGQTPPLHGQLCLQGICFPSHAPSYVSKVFWRNPRDPVPQTTQTARQWMVETAASWPTWNDAQWQAHVEGFALAPQMDKPLWHLSTGSLRKLWMAAALASGADLTLIDEPIAGLDQPSIRYLSTTLETLADDLATNSSAPRWILVAHWESLPGVTWDEVVAFPPHA